MGIALETILKNIYLLVIERRMPNEQLAFLLNRLGDIEYRLSIGCQEHLALASLIGAFT
jgi:replication factor C subunit 3/5